MEGVTSRGSAALQDRLETVRLRLRDAAAVPDPAAFVALFGGLLRWAADQRDEAPLGELEASGYLGQHFESFAGYQRRYLTELEMAESAALLARRTPRSHLGQVLDSEFGRQTYRRVAEALELANFSACRRFVMIGCGPFPAAVLFIHDHTATPEIVGLDRDRRAIEMATRVVAAFARDRVRVAADDGECFDYAGVDIVYVANHVAPKARVVQRIADTVDANAQVIVREPFGYGRLFAESGIANLDPRFLVSAIGEGHPHFLSRHVRLARCAR